MTLMESLFKPNGRIGSSTFWRGLIVLIAIGVVSQVIQLYGPVSVSMILGVVGLAMIYPYVALYAKRFHDSGRTGWWFVPAILGFGVIAYFVGTFIQGMFAPDMQEMLEIAAESGNISSIMEVSQEMSRKIFLPNLLAGLAMQFGLGYVVASLKSDPETNKFGPPEGGDVDVFN
ncbi:MAG: DUF805 domain-containing protein [Hyphomonadaceae bacterium]